MPLTGDGTVGEKDFHSLREASVSNQKIYGLMVAAAFFWAGAFIAGKVSSPYIPAFTLTFMRFLIATAILYFIRKHQGENYQLSRKDVPVFLFTGIVGMFGYHVFFFTALRYTTAINSSIIAAINPILTTSLGIAFIKEKVNWKRGLGILLSFTGVFLTITVADPEVIRGLSVNRGDLLMLVAVLLWAIYSVYSKKVGHRFTPMILTYYSFFFCTVFLIPFVIWEKPWEFFLQIPKVSFVAVVYMSVFPSVIGYLVQQMAIKQIGPAKTSIFVNLVPVFSIILSVLLLHETISPIKIFTTLIIISGVYICQKG